jgi:ATP phosphoribosyltransferase
MKTKLILAIQKKGRLSSDSFNLLEKSGLRFEASERNLKIEVDNFSLEILLLRAGDIPEIVSDGIADIGIVGQNIVAEKGYNIQEIEQLGFGKCSLNLAYSENEKDTKLQGKRIATSYPNLLKKYLNQEKIDAQVVELSGSVELAPRLKISDLICDLVSTGSTLRNNGLKKGENIFNSQAVIVKNNSISEEKQKILDKLLLRIKAVLAARNCKYIIMNAKKEDLPGIKNCISNSKKLTISPLADSKLLSIALVVEESSSWAIIEELKIAGAFDILVFPIEKMII